MRIKYLFITFLVGIATLGFSYLLLGKDENKSQAPLFDNLGEFHFSISTKSPLAQRFFDQGMTPFYGFEWASLYVLLKKQRD